eukprot:TRINITY_DN19007_c0_g2_i1.p1 TRINITY_DN19007_c0_g2~~TRINITY_DN19007_c0_g2_i1.p1  ORF type:complete len:916 (-),score=128.42 TRINITY_DN19007_c0_g2_i1:39-2519(-)
MDKTSLADVLAEEEGAKEKAKPATTASKEKVVEAPDTPSSTNSLDLDQITTDLKQLEGEVVKGDFDLYSYISSHQALNKRKASEMSDAGDASSPKKQKPNEDGGFSGEGKPQTGPYTTDLEYLGDVFKQLANLIKIRNAEADIKDDDPEFLVQPKTEAEALLRELRGKERVQRGATEKRLAKTREVGSWLPRVEQLATKRGLSTFERQVLLLLVGGVISHDILIAANGKYVLRGEEKRDRTIGYVLYVLCDTLEQRVSNRSYFYKSSPLVKDGMITVSDRPVMGGDLMDCYVDIDRRMLDYLVGLDSEFAEIVDGSHLFVPKIKIENVILPKEHKDLVMQTVGNFDAFTECKKKYKLDDVVSYGAGLVLLFHGASGTGKTMLANAIAHQVHKKLLFVNLSAMLTTAKCGDMLKLVFREAKLHDALIFFDECESFFESRSKNPTVTSLLVELERYSGLIILATNKPYSLDDAMNRRITLAIEFKAPDHNMRREIWLKHVPAEMKTADDVDFATLALDYELSGGLIKNALISALSIAVARDGASPTLTMADFRQGAKLQLRSFFEEEGTAHKILPTRGLDACVFPEHIKTSLKQIVALEKGRKMLYTQWGFTKEECAKNSATVLCSGIKGTGKSLAAEAIGYETGSTLKVVNIAEILSVGHDLAATLDKIFEDANKQQAILVFEDCERLLGGDHEDPCRLMAHHISQYNRVCLFMMRTDSHFYTHNNILDFKFRIHLQIPNHKQRVQLWQNALPKQAPKGSDINFEELARRELTGGQIKAAAFYAAASASVQTQDEKRTITMKMLTDSVEEVLSHSNEQQIANSGLFT